MSTKKRKEIRELLEKIELNPEAKKSILKVLDIMEDKQVETMLAKIKELNSS